MQVTLVPFQGVDDTYLNSLAEDLEKQQFQIQISAPIDVPEQAYNRRRDQYMADPLLKVLEKHTGERVLGVADIDLYRYVLKCVYGMADLPGRCALISLYRLHVTPSAEVFRQRVDKLAIHELGHTIGLEHCDNHNCVMHFSACLDDLDHTSMCFCPRCKQKVIFNS